MFDDRFARQNRCEPPPEFPLASPYSGIVHHLSGPNRHALTQTFHRRSWSVGGAPTLLLSLRIMVCHHNTRTHVRLLGPCFKTGRSEPFRQHRRRAENTNACTQPELTLRVVPEQASTER